MQPTSQYATFFQRLLAHIIDTVLVGTPVIALVFYILVPMFLNFPVIQAAKDKEVELAIELYTSQVYIALLSAICMAFVLTIFAISKWQATPGKRIIGIYISMRNGAKPQFRAAFGRFISLPLFLLLLQFFERRETYQKLSDLKTPGRAITNIEQLEQYLNGPVTALTTLIILVVISFWYLKIVFSSEHTAVHDTLFETRVLQGKK